MPDKQTEENRGNPNAFGEFLQESEKLKLFNHRKLATRRWMAGPVTQGDGEEKRESAKGFTRTIA